MRVLLLNPPFIKDFMRNARCEGVSISGTQWYPIWLAYCTGWLEKNGHQCKLIDAPPANMTYNDVMRETEKFLPQLLVMYSSWESFDNDIKIAKKLKKRIGCKIVFVGPWVTAQPDVIFQKFKNLDFIARGEFDNIVLDLANEISPKSIKGLSFSKNKKIFHNKPRKPITGKELNDFPYVSDIYRRHLDINNYHVIQQLHPFVDMFTGRGCDWGLCTFCLWVYTITNTKPKYRVRDVGNIVEEIKWIKKNIPQIKEIFFQDDMIPENRIKEICNSVINEKLDIAWSTYSKANLSYEALKLMKKSGCRMLHIGFETANQNILNNIRKGITVNIMEKFIKNAKKAGIELHADFVFGFPGETEETIKQTIKWAFKFDMETYQFSIPRIYLGTPMYEELSSKGWLKGIEPDYPHLSNERIRHWAKKATRDYYLSWSNIKKLNMSKIKRLIKPTIINLFPGMFWKRW